jgi:hypothetical protein
MTITLHHGSFDNWFVLGNERMQRINGADIEGDRDEWEQVASAIERGESILFKRCAAVRKPDGTWLLSSPRNSMSPTIVNAKEASWIAAEIRRVLASTPVDVPQPYDGDEP